MNEFEKTGEKVSDSIKLAVLMRSVTGNLKTWLQLRLTDCTSYSELRESILAFERSTTKWVDEMMPGGEVASGSGDTAPMEVDRVKGDGKYDKGKAKGKGKGKKGDWKTYEAMADDQWKGDALYFVEDLLNRLSDGTEETRDIVLNLDEQLGPVTVLT